MFEAFDGDFVVGEVEDFEGFELCGAGEGADAGVAEVVVPEAEEA